MEGEGNSVEKVTVETTRTANCETTRTTMKDFYVEHNNEESQAWALVERIVFLVIAAVLLFGKELETTIH